MTSKDVEINETFKQITDRVVYEEANRLLDRHKNRVKAWIANERKHGRDASLNDLIKKLMAEPNQRHHVISSLSASLLRIIELESE